MGDRKQSIYDNIHELLSPSDRATKTLYVAVRESLSCMPKWGRTQTWAKADVTVHWRKTIAGRKTEIMCKITISYFIHVDI